MADAETQSESKEYKEYADRSKMLFQEELAKSSFANEVHDFVPLESSYSTIPADLTKIDEHQEVLSKICEDLFGIALRPATEKELEEALIAHARLQNELSDMKIVENKVDGHTITDIVSTCGATSNVASGEQTLHPPEHPNPSVPVSVQSIEFAVVPTIEDGGNANI
jgi:hypothetical protein